MFSVTCVTEAVPEGGYKLASKNAASDSATKWVSLKGSLAELWEQLEECGRLPHREQQRVFASMNREARSRLVALLATLEDKGIVALGKGDLAKAASVECRTLDKVHLELTHRCNFQCEACYIGPKLQKASGSSISGELTAAEWGDVIDDAASLGCIEATVTGGEPFLRPDIFEILESLDSHIILVNINTNASAITPEKAARLRPLMIRSVSISLYGYDRQSAAEYSKNGAGHDAAMRGIQYLVDAGVPVAVKYFATQNNNCGFEKVEQELKPLGVTPYRVGHSIHSDIFQGGGLTQIANTISVASLPRPTTTQEAELPCHPARSEITIEPDGKIRACPKISVYFGNAYHDGLKKIWHESSSMSNFRRFWPDYCEAEGFVKGAELQINCPAAAMLTKANGFATLHQMWRNWEIEHRV